jgi:hypothetical protein
VRWLWRWWWEARYESWPPYRAALAAEGGLYKVLLLTVFNVVGWLILSATLGGIVAGIVLLPFDAMFGSPPLWLILTVWGAFTALVAFVLFGLWGELLTDGRESVPARPPDSRPQTDSRLR